MPPKKEVKKRKGFVEYTQMADPQTWVPIPDSAEDTATFQLQQAMTDSYHEKLNEWLKQSMYAFYAKEMIKGEEEMKKQEAFSLAPEHIGKKVVCVDSSYGGWGNPKLLEYLVPLSFHQDGSLMADQALKFIGDPMLYTYHSVGDYWTPRIPSHKAHFNGNGKVWSFYEQVLTEPVKLTELTKDNYGDTIRYDNQSNRTIIFDSFETDNTGAIFVRGNPIIDSAGGYAHGEGKPKKPAFPSMVYYLYEDAGGSNANRWWLVKKKDLVDVDAFKSETEGETMSDEQKSGSDAVVKGLATLLIPELEKKLAGVIDEKKVNDLIKKAFAKANKPKAIEVTIKETGSIQMIETPHKDLDRLLYYIQKRHHVYLYGPAGSGKSTAACQIAEALKLTFGYLSLNPQTPDSRILGFIDAGGTYRPTPFYNCYKNGGVFCIDEMDNASASLLTTLNSMLENGHGAFPGELVERHKDFVLVATGNTNGRGANPMFPERRPFDVAFAERFTFLYWDYDSALEQTVTLQINPNATPWLEWVKQARTYTSKNYPKVLVSPRAAFKGAEYLRDGKMTALEIAEALVFKGLDKQTIEKIVSNVPLPTSSSMVVK